MLKEKYKKAIERMAETGKTRVVVEAEDNSAEGGVAYELNEDGMVVLHQWTGWGGGSTRRPSASATEYLRSLRG
jgi:hypothetical protein